ncbi:hypothetical protein NC652_009778 [Populus alba x Populus x berolinensis]|nr:hypothetical protein NC652_009778 [Populus alba x Populus x berolinensis]
MLHINNFCKPIPTLEFLLIGSLKIYLATLFYEDRETFSCSSSEADDIDSLEPGSYCVWTPKKEEGSPRRATLQGLIQRDGSSKILFTRVIVMVRILLCS